MQFSLRYQFYTFSVIKYETKNCLFFSHTQTKNNNNSHVMIMDLPTTSLIKQDLPSFRNSPLGFVTYITQYSGVRDMFGLFILAESIPRLRIPQNY